MISYIVTNKGPLIYYVRVSRVEGKSSTYFYLGGQGGQTHSYVIFSKSIFYIRNHAVKWFGWDHYFIYIII